jgi:glutamine synthetase
MAMSKSDPQSEPELKARIESLRQAGVRQVRLNYSDLHGTARGKDIPLELVKDLAQDGAAFCVANLTDGLASNPTNAPGLAPDRGYPDMKVTPVLSTLAQLPWDPATAWCIGQVQAEAGGDALSPRCLLERMIAGFEGEVGLVPVAGPELEFFLLRQTPDGRLVRYEDRPSMVYTAGKRADPEGLIREILSAARAMGLQAIAANHEFGRSQFEVNLLHGEALSTADRTFLFKALVKEIAVEHNLVATFMGKPFNDDGGSGFHLHLSLFTPDGTNAFAAPREQGRLTEIGCQFMAGLLEHAPALTAFFAPTINSYKRLRPDSLVPTAVNWGYDNRTAFVRVPADRGKGTRLEVRLGDAAANPYLIIAASLLAGLDGIRRKLQPPAPITGDVSVGTPLGPRLPHALTESLAALQADPVLCEGLGQTLVNAFVAMKSIEAERFRTFVTDWEINEYAWHL